MAAKRKGVIHFTRIEACATPGAPPGMVYSLPFVLIVEGEYPRSLEVQIKEFARSRRRAEAAGSRSARGSEHSISPRITHRDGARLLRSLEPHDATRTYPVDLA